MSQFGSPHIPGHNPTQGTATPVAPKPAAVHVEETSPIGLINDAEASTGEHKIKAIVGSGSVRKSQYKRAALTPGTGACRVRTFHGKLSDQGLEYMDNQINEWLDAHSEVEVKFVTSSVGVFEGKIREPALVLNLWY